LGVSIPHRYARNGKKDAVSWARLGVSIPHRYARNLKPSWSSNKGAATFQFLI